jgi:hypothetical protein
MHGAITPLPIHLHGVGLVKQRDNLSIDVSHDFLSALKKRPGE